VADEIISVSDARTLNQTYRHWAPLRSMDKAEDALLGIGHGRDIGGPEMKRALGRFTPAEAPLAFAITAAIRSIMRGEHNKMLRRFHDMVVENKKSLGDSIRINPKETKRAINPRTGFVMDVYDPFAKLQDNFLRLKIEGKEVHLEFREDLESIPIALKGLSSVTGGAFIEGIGTATRTLAALSTRWNPAFIPFNAIRDAGQAFVRAGGEHGVGFAARVLAGIPAAYKALAKYNEVKLLGFLPNPSAEMLAAVGEYQQSGGRISFLNLQDVGDKQKQLRRAVETLGGGTSNLIWKNLQVLGDLIGGVSDVVENATRLSMYVQSRKPTSEGGLGLSAERSASQSKNITINFEKKGEIGHFINSLFMFSNAGIQGMYRQTKSARDHRGTVLMLGSVATVAAMMEIVMHAIAGDDEDGINHYDKIPDWGKRSNFIFMDPLGSGEAIMIPLPYVVNFFWALGHESAAMFLGHQSAKEGSLSLMASFADSFNPLGGGGDPAQIIFPTVVKPIYQFGANVDWKGDPIKPEPFPFGLKKPQSQQHWPQGGSPVARWLTAKLNSITGGDEVVPGAVDINPEYVQHFAEFLTGGLGRFVHRTEAAIEKAFVGEDIDVSREVPFLRRLYWTPDQRFHRKQYRAHSVSVTQFDARMRAYRSSGEAAAARQLKADNPILARMVTPMKVSQKRVRALKARIKRQPEQEEALTEKLRAEYLRINKRMHALEEAR